MIRKDASSGPGFVANADASMISSIENPVIKATVHMTKTNAFKETPRAEDLAILYCQMAAFLQVLFYAGLQLYSKDGKWLVTERYITK